MTFVGPLFVWSFVAVLCAFSVWHQTRTMVNDGFTRWQVIMSGVGLVLVFASPAAGALFEPRGVNASAWAWRLTLGAAAVCWAIPMGAHYLSRFRRCTRT